MVIKVVNKRTAAPVPENTIRVYVGRPSILGNPFTHLKDKSTLAEYKVDTRQEAVDKYLTWLMKKLKNLEEVFWEVERLYQLSLNYDIELECWCAPLSCHADIIKFTLERSWPRLQKEGWYRHEIKSRNNGV